jgi:putative Holliday junction resolvase
MARRGRNTMTDDRPPSQPVVELPRSGSILAVDWGEKRIGLATSDESQTIAHPLGVLTRRSGRRFPLKRLREYLDTYESTGLLLGLPLTEDGEDGPAARAVHALAELLHDKTGLPVALWDERMTTARVLRDMRGTGAGAGTDTPQPPNKEIDHLAATVLLQSYLDSRRARETLR